MKEYRVSYMIGSMYHAYIVDAESWGHAVKRVVNGMQDGSLAKLHDLKVEERKD